MLLLLLDAEAEAEAEVESLLKWTKIYFWIFVDRKYELKVSPKLPKSKFFEHSRGGNCFAK
jgi:hypothetical protein